MLTGIDGCPNAWIAVIQHDSGELSTQLTSNLKSFLDQHPWKVVAIDITIGLVDSGARNCDVQARQLLGKRKNSVFPAPLRPALAGKTRLAAHEISMSIHGKGVGAQSFGIYPKIKEVDELFLENPACCNNVYEVHPELCFYEWNGASPMANPKRTGPGFMERLTLVESHFGPGSFEAIRSAYPRSKVHDDDILDAFAALWSAQRIASRTAIPCPNPPEVDAEGIPMVMWR